MTSWILLSSRSSTVNTQIAQLPETEVVPVAALGCLESPVEGGGGVVSRPQPVPSVLVTTVSHHPANPRHATPVHHHQSTNHPHLCQQSPLPIYTYLCHSLTGWNWQVTWTLLRGSFPCCFSCAPLWIYSVNLWIQTPSVKGSDFCYVGIAVNWNSPVELYSRKLSTRRTTYQSHLFEVFCFHNKAHQVIPAFSRLCVTVTGTIL
ncbi:hypothetical protein QQF64_035816 [Cirrhinus molitorella]|uniref:Uncharacterized protein n=1 Tax=Cirrhinus molitorella TaxID=172907 RepID=A0ABR3NGT3_9TELE